MQTEMKCLCTCNEIIGIILARGRKKWSYNNAIGRNTRENARMELEKDKVRSKVWNCRFLFRKRTNFYEK